MTELSRSLLSAAREGLAPDPDVAARVRAKVAAAVVASTAAATGSHAVAATASAGAPAPAAAPAPVPAVAPAAATPSAATPSAAGSSSLMLKLAAALLVLGVSAAVVVVSQRADRVPDVPQLGVVPDEVDDFPARVRVVVPNDPPVQPPEVPHSRAAPAPLAVAAASTPPVAPHVTPTPEREPATLSREVELIDLAMVSLRKNAPLAAIEAIRVFERETLGRGQMAEEAAAIEIEARCKLHEDVTAALALFDRTWPESAQRERIQTTCFARK